MLSSPTTRAMTTHQRKRGRRYIINNNQYAKVRDQNLFSTQKQTQTFLA